MGALPAHTGDPHARGERHPIERFGDDGRSRIRTVTKEAPTALPARLRPRAGDRRPHDRSREVPARPAPRAPGLSASAPRGGPPPPRLTSPAPRAPAAPALSAIRGPSSLTRAVGNRHVLDRRSRARRLREEAHELVHLLYQRSSRRATQRQVGSPARSRASSSSTASAALVA